MNVLILYATATGNTEILAETMANYLKKLQHQVTMKNFDFDQITAEEIKDYDATLIGIYTYDYGELPFETEFFYDELDEVDLTGNVFGVFGAGDSFYGDTFCTAVDDIHDKLIEQGAAVDSQTLKVDLTPEKEDIEKCVQMVERVIALAEKKADAKN